MQHTLAQYRNELTKCRETFEKKVQDYGSSWRILRLPSITDQMYIKAQRIRTLQETDKNMVGDSEVGEFGALVNYGIIALIQIEVGVSQQADNWSPERCLEHYDTQAAATEALMLRKNHDYGEAWRDMRVSSITDIILTKLLRIKQIENNKGKTLVSEGVDANYKDIINYAIFSLILLN
ncbi:MAG: DUF1599 domain-containing protein [Bacteroidetes bacterium]|nr:DUF1599 domain-containing protein [Bacteroidota bacterium]